MIFDSLKNLEQYKNVHPRVYRGLQLLRDTDFSALTETRYEVEGEDLFFFLQDYETRPVNDTPEAHRKYADIQFVLSGREKFDVAPLQDMTEEVEAHPDRDLWLYHGRISASFVLEGDKFVVAFPGDAHAPCIAVDAPEQVHKVVVKVKL